jgi:hypothetical protein
MSFASERLQPGHTTSIRIEADKNSLCAVGIVDKSVESMGKLTWLTADKVCICIFDKNVPTCNVDTALHIIIIGSFDFDQIRGTTIQRKTLQQQLNKCW